MEPVSFYIPERLDGLNELINAARSHWTKGREQKRGQEQIICWAIRKSRPKPIDQPFVLKLHFSEPNNKRDPDNITSAKKYILDALQTMGIIPNDNQKYVKGFEDTWGVATEEQPMGVYVTLQPLDK